jgi:hypothetical protein
MAEPDGSRHGSLEFRGELKGAGLTAKIRACLNRSFSVFVNTLATNPT